MIKIKEIRMMTYTLYGNKIGSRLEQQAILEDYLKE